MAGTIPWLDLINFADCRTTHLGSLTARRRRNVGGRSKPNLQAATSVHRVTH